MSNSRRTFIKTGITAGIAGISLLPAINTFANEYKPAKAVGKFKLRFALVSDGHYAQPDTDCDTFYHNMIGWMNREHQDNHLDFVIVNGDLVHNRPDLLPKVKETYLDN